MRNTAIKLLVIILAGSYLIAASACNTVGSDEVGVRVINVPFDLPPLWTKGVQTKTLVQGKYFYPPKIVTYYNLKTKVRSLDMRQEGGDLLREAGRPVEATKAIKEDQQTAAQQPDISQQMQAFKQETAAPPKYKIVIHDRPTKDHSVRVKTSDGNDAWVDVVVTYRIIPDDAWKVIENFKVLNGGKVIDLEELDSTVESLARGTVRSWLGALDTNEILRAEDRRIRVEGIWEKDAKKKKGAIDELNEKLNKFGLEIVKLSAPAVTIHPAYDDILNRKRVAEEEKEEYQAYQQRAVQEKETKINKARGEADSMIELARGSRSRIIQEADGEFEAKKLQAEAMQTKYNQLAVGIAAQAEALSGPGGSAQVGLAITEAIKGKQIMIVPGQGSINMLDVNDLIQSYGAVKALKAEAGKNDSAAPTP